MVSESFVLSNYSHGALQTSHIQNFKRPMILKAIMACVEAIKMVCYSPQPMKTLEIINSSKVIELLQFLVSE